MVSRSSSDSLNCARCKSFSHRKCLSLSKIDFDKLKNSKKPWFCVSCAVSNSADISGHKASVTSHCDDKEETSAANLTTLGPAIQTLIQKPEDAALQRMAAASADHVTSLFNEFEKRQKAYNSFLEVTLNEVKEELRTNSSKISNIETSFEFAHGEVELIKKQVNDIKVDNNKLLSEYNLTLKLSTSEHKIMFWSKLLNLIVWQFLAYLLLTMKISLK